jgi:His/Glu/Gln/Arg/opine family amino acid ABC transporter permease subunit
MIDFTLILDSLPALLKGAAISLQIASLSASIGLSLGLFLGIVESRQTYLSLFVRVFVTLFRGTPMLVQILFVFYVLPQFGIAIAPFWAASLAIGLNSSAYISQIVRAGIQAVPKGQIEAAQTLGLSATMTMRAIVLPQAFRIALPTLGNELITLLKDSSLASIIGVMELSKSASIIRSYTYDAFSVLFAIALIYLLMTFTISVVIRKLEGSYA